MNCANCGDTMRLDDDKDYFVCDSCRTTFFPEPDDQGVRILAEGAAMKCPVCAVQLSRAAVEGVRLFYCTQCRGMLIPVDVFLTLVESARAKQSGTREPPRRVNPRDMDRVIHCPGCGEPMDTHPYAGPGNVVIDNCPNCELNWLDNHELMHIARAEE